MQTCLLVNSWLKQPAAWKTEYSQTPLLTPPVVLSKSGLNSGMVLIVNFDCCGDHLLLTVFYSIMGSCCDWSLFDSSYMTTISVGCKLLYMLTI